MAPASNPSWKDQFQAHRVAAKMGNNSDNYLYHREQQAFPTPLGRQKRDAMKAKAKPSAFRQGLNRIHTYLLPGGSHSNVGIAFGAALPVVGALVLYTFMASNTGAANQQASLVQHEASKASRV